MSLCLLPQCVQHQVYSSLQYPLHICSAVPKKKLVGFCWMLDRAFRHCWSGGYLSSNIVQILWRCALDSYDFSKRYGSSGHRMPPLVKDPFPIVSHLFPFVFCCLVGECPVLGDTPMLPDATSHGLLVRQELRELHPLQFLVAHQHVLQALRVASGLKNHTRCCPIVSKVGL